MQVTAYKTVDIECEVEIDMDDILSEFSQRADESGDTYWRRLMSAMDTMTRIMAKISDETISAMPASSCNILCERLAIQAARYAARSYPKASPTPRPESK